jgi:hypothetical protein
VMVAALSGAFGVALDICASLLQGLRVLQPFEAQRRRFAKGFP